MRVYNFSTMYERGRLIQQVTDRIDEYTLTTRGKKRVKTILRQRRRALLEALADTPDLTPSHFRMVSPHEGPSGRPGFTYRRCINCGITPITHPLLESLIVDMYNDREGTWMCRGCHSTLYMCSKQ